MTELQTLRRGLEGIVELLLALLDELDGNCDDEDNGDQEDGEDTDLEPSHGGIGSYINGRLEYDLELDTSDDEPSLGRLETVHQGAASYAQSWLTDAEYDVATEPHDAEEGV